MKWPIIFVACICLLKVMCKELDINPKLNEYIKISRYELDKFSKKMHFKRETKNVEVKEASSISYPRYNNNSATIFTLHNATFCLLDNDLFYVQSNNDKINITFLEKLPQKQKIVFTKTFENTEITLLLNGLESEINIYNFTSTDINFVHSISTPYLRDAKFVFNNNELYLVVITKDKENVTMTFVYKWVGTYFDEIQRVHTKGAFKISSFTSLNSEILIFLQHIPKELIHSSIYELKWGKIKKIQPINTIHPIHVDTYINEGQNFVIIYEKSKNNAIYSWRGSKLLKRLQFETDFDIEKSGVLEKNGSSVIITALLDKIKVYSSEPSTMKLEDEKKYSTQQSTILSLHSKTYTENTTVFLIGLTDDNINIMRFELHLANSYYTPKTSEDKYQLRNCFDNLEQRLYNKNKYLKDAKSNLNNFKNNTFQSIEKKSDIMLGVAQGKVTENEANIDAAKTKLQNIKSILNNYQVIDDNLIINGTVTIKGSVEVEKLISKDLKIENINGQKWIPEQWLMYNKSQTITGKVSIQNITTRTLDTSSEDIKFKDFLLKNGNQTIAGATIINLTVNDMVAKNINGIPVDNIYSKNNPELITGVKQFQNLKTSNAKIKLLNKKVPENVLSLFINSSSDYILDDNILIENLSVETVNNVNWTSFKDNVLRIGVTKEIFGNLTLTKMKTKNVTVNTINGINVDNLLTTSTNQVIDSNISFHRIFAENITTNKTNEIKLKETAVLLKHNMTVTGPVRFDDLNVEKNLELVGKIDKSLFLRNGDHIAGTNESDLLQRYIGKVKIKGNLYLSNVHLENGSKVFIMENETNPNVSSLYWTKSTNQSIPVHFQAQRVTVPHIYTDVLNGVNISRYFMINNNETKLETNLNFENVTVLGNVKINNEAKHVPNLKEIIKNAVKTNGSYIISGKKIYNGTLVVDHLVALKLNNISVLDTLTTNTTDVLTGKKFFKNIIIKGNLTSDVSVDSINNANIKDLLKRTLYIDQPQDFNKLNFKNITVSDLYVSKINKHNISKYIFDFEKISSMDKINTLRVDGNVSIQNVQNVSKINGIDYFELLNNTFKLGEYGGILEDIKFTGHVKVNNLLIEFINDIDLKELVNRFLLKKDHQNITAKYNFDNIKADTISTPKINKINVNNILDVSSKKLQVLNVPNGLKFSPVMLKSLVAEKMTPCNIEMALNSIFHPPPREWTKMDILQNATILDDRNILYRVFENAATTNSKNVFKAPVKFSHHILADNVYSIKEINDINITEIIHDGVLKDSEQNQTISGQKFFPSLRALNVEIWKNADTRLVNNINIQRLNENIIDKNQVHSQVIKGKKIFFEGLQCERFYNKDILEPNSIVTLNDRKKVSSAIFESIEVHNNLNINYINDENFDAFLKSRLLKRGHKTQIVSGVFYFENIEAQNIDAPFINKIKIDDIVFDMGYQNISSSKTFLQNVDIFGNATCDYINDINISKTYKNSLKTGEDANIEGNVTILSSSKIFGNITTKNINNYPVAQIKEIVNIGITQAETTAIQSLKNSINDIILKNVDLIKALKSDYMYIEKSNALQISVPAVSNAKIISSKGYVLIHVTGEESGKICNLRDNCKCPVQYSIEVSPEHSISIFPNKGSQRIFSYDGEDIIIHFITNSVSTNSSCRIAQVPIIHEGSVLTWSTSSTRNTTGAFYQYDKFITGYISGAEFFTLNRKTYAVIGRYYNPIANTHTVDCLVIKFNENKSKGEEIQRIPTEGAWSIYLFHTAQGVTLIIGSSKNPNKYDEKEETRIYRFNESTETFGLLRIVPSYGCSMATGVTVNTDSLIVLAHKSRPLQILKYSYNFDNYYFYQSFELDATVLGISVFYTGGFGISDAYLCIITANDNYFIYSFRFIEGWKLESSGEIEGLRNLIPFELNKKSYIFAPSTKFSSLYTIVKHGSL